MSDDVLEVDLLVLGAGMAGMSAAAYSADHGARVLVVEKGPEPGGSAVLSGAVIWTGRTPEAIAGYDPAQDPAFGKLLAEGYDPAVAWIESLGIAVGPAFDLAPNQGFPSRGRTFDVYAFIRTARAHVQDAGGWIITEAEAESLTRDDAGRVTGAMIRDRDGVTPVRAGHVLLATGGYQASAELMATYYGDHAAGLALRSNPHSTGGGVRLARSAGAAMRPPTPSFYGHLMPAPLARPLEPRDFSRLSQQYSMRAILLDKDGKRFTDESEGYYVNSSDVARLPDRRALLVGDDRTRQEGIARHPGQEQVDRILEAQREGAHVVFADTLEALEAAVAPWGYRGVAAAVERYNRALETQDAALDPPRRRLVQPLTQAPFFAVETQPSVTFSFRGIATDVDGHVLDAEGRAIPGLLAAGAEASFFHTKYFGGLAMSCVFGLRAAREALRARPVSAA